jgi:hypothetical protein
MLLMRRVLIACRRSLYQHVAKLPHMVLQQYFGADASSKPDISQLNAKLAAEKEGVVTTVGESTSSRLRQVLQQVRDALASGTALPAGTLYLSRGGELLGEPVGVDIGDGQVLNVSSYPALVPALQQLVGSTAFPAVARERATSAATAADSSMNSTNSAAPVNSAPTKGSIPQHDFVAAYKTLTAARPSSNVHLVVLQHGFLGFGCDMQLIDNALRLELGFAVEVITSTARRS